MWRSGFWQCEHDWVRLALPINIAELMIRHSADKQNLFEQECVVPLGSIPTYNEHVLQQEIAGFSEIGKYQIIARHFKLLQRHHVPVLRPRSEKAVPNSRNGVDPSH